MPFFSIIIPVYNVAPYLSECLDSVLAQTFMNWESICVDDGSTDGSVAILNEYATKDKRFRVFQQQHSGVSNARNRGLREAQGKWIGFIDADDIVTEKWLETAADAIVKQKADLVRMNLRYWYCRRGLTYTGLDVDTRVIEGRDAVFEWGWRNLLNGGWTFLLFIDASLVGRHAVSFPEGVDVREDVFFALDAARYSSIVVQLPYDGYKYRIHSHSAYHKSRRLVECIRFIDECCCRIEKDMERIRRIGFEHDAKRLLGKAIGSMVVEWFETGNRNEHKHNLDLVVRLRGLIEKDMLAETDMPHTYRRGFRQFKRTGSMTVWRRVGALERIWRRVKLVARMIVCGK